MTYDGTVKYSCVHYTEVLNSYAELLEKAADVQNSLAMESDTELGIFLSKSLFRAIKRACEELGAFLKDHDPDESAKRPELVLYPPAREL